LFDLDAREDNIATIPVGFMDVLDSRVGYGERIVSRICPTQHGIFHTSKFTLAQLS